MNKNILFGGLGVAIIIVLVIVFTSSGADDMMDSNDEITMEETMTETFMVTIKNTSSDQPLAPGVYIVHDASATLNYEGMLAPAAFESMAEIGDPTALAALVEDMEGVMATFIQTAPVLPGESMTFELTSDVDKKLMISGVQMAVGSNDGYTIIDAEKLFDRNGLIEATYEAMNQDNGTEENTDLGSGFDGGQPDPSRGAENVNQGTTTSPTANVSKHDQLTSTLLELTVSAK